MKRPIPHQIRSKVRQTRRAPAPSRREQFLLCVFSGALARDIREDTNDAQLIARAAAQIPPDQLPPCPVNAAAVYLNYCYHGPQRGAPWRWMLTGTS